MIPITNKPIAQLPVVPARLLFQHSVYNEFDTRFRACARLLQALWRKSQSLPIGTYESSGGRRRQLGSLLSLTAAEEGRNFLTPEIAEIARLETAYQERGALIDQKRLYGNLLSSMPLCFNLFAPLAKDSNLAVHMLRALLPGIDLAVLRHVWFEHSPGRRDPTLSGDRSAFDVAFI